MNAMLRIVSFLLCAVLLLSAVGFAAGFGTEDGELPPTPIGGGTKTGIYGDCNGDGVVSGKDVTALRRSIAGGYGATIIMALSDCNGDAAVTGKDVTLIRRYIAGGYDAERVGKPYTP